MAWRATLRHGRRSSGTGFEFRPHRFPPREFSLLAAPVQKGHPVTMLIRTKKNIHVHGARGCFSFALFLFHVCNSGLAPDVIGHGWLQPGAQSLQYGVELFFGISGIVIIGARRRAKSSRLFLFERCSRIFPVLWVTVLTILALEIVTGQKLRLHADLASALVLGGNLLAMPLVIPMTLIHPAAWSLSFEFSFYILFALYAANDSGGAIWRKRLAFALGTIFVLTHVRGLFFVSGLVIAQGVFARPALRGVLRAGPVWLIAFLALWTTAGEVVGEQFSGINVAALTSHPWLLPDLVLGWAAGTLALAGIYEGEGPLAQLMATRALQWLGTVSYSLYLWQTPVMAVIKFALVHSGLAAAAGPFAQALFFVIALPPTLIVAGLSQRLLEVDATNWMRRSIEGRGAPQHESS